MLGEGDWVEDAEPVRRADELGLLAPHPATMIASPKKVDAIARIPIFSHPGFRSASGFIASPSF
jgi:hypothetical protein